MRFQFLTALILGLSLPAMAEFRPLVNIDDLAKISWKNGEAKLIIRNDWLENFLNISFNEAIQDSPDLKEGSGEVHMVDQLNSSDSIVAFGFSFNVVPRNVWLNPHVLCDGRLRLSFPPTDLAHAQIQILDREPIRNCQVNGSVGQGLDLGRLVRDKLNERISQSLNQNFLFKIGQALFGTSDFMDRMSRMYLLQELVPFATLGMDDCEADAELGLPAGNSVCLSLRWPAGKFDAALAKILSQAPRATPALGQISEAQIQKWRESAPVCAKDGQIYPSKEHCETGDMNLFAGLLCISGEEAGCKMVANSQDAQGRWWRSPMRVGLENENFSPDMFLGTVAYLNQTHDVARFQKWVNFIQSDYRTYPTQGSPRLAIFQSCPAGADGVCNVMGSEWFWLNQMTSWAEPFASPLPNYGHDPSWLVVEALANERGFRLHLVGVSVLLHKLFTPNLDPNIDVAAKILAAREPENPFFLFLALGHDEKVLRLLQKQCPADGAKPAQQNQWSWERKIEEKAYTHSMGWDCVFMGNLWNRGN